MQLGVTTKDIYIDPNGEDYYSIEGFRVRNRYGNIKIDDFKAFESGMIKLKDPSGLVKFIFGELDFKDINIFTN